MISTPPPSRPTDQSAGPAAGVGPERAAALQDEPRWPIWAAPAAIAVGFGAGIFISIVVGAIGSAGGSSLAHPTPAVALISDVLFDLAFVGAAIFFSGVRGRANAAEFGFRRVSAGKAIVALIITAVSYYVLTAVYASILNLHGNDKLRSEERRVGKECKCERCAYR